MKGTLFLVSFIAAWIAGILFGYTIGYILDAVRVAKDRNWNFIPALSGVAVTMGLWSIIIAIYGSAVD